MSLKDDLKDIPTWAWFGGAAVGGVLVLWAHMHGKSAQQTSLPATTDLSNLPGVTSSYPAAGSNLDTATIEAMLQSIMQNQNAGYGGLGNGTGNGGGVGNLGGGSTGGATGGSGGGAAGGTAGGGGSATGGGTSGGSGGGVSGPPVPQTPPGIWNIGAYIDNATGQYLAYYLSNTVNGQTTYYQANGPNQFVTIGGIQELTNQIAQFIKTGGQSGGLVTLGSYGGQYGPGNVSGYPVPPSGSTAVAPMANVAGQNLMQSGHGAYPATGPMVGHVSWGSVHGPQVVAPR